MRFGVPWPTAASLRQIRGGPSSEMVAVSVYWILLSLVGCLAEVLEPVTVETKYGEIRGRRHRQDYDIGKGRT
ncbi:hypothetical protein LSH36_55g02011 [Paralvinella palmiformis]|uniref:Uncharacterized protein n=1 Tax=Paralvinella palmiformis TaxID=53620 RepID=A0AAD9K6J3_9ANNE|nr:hypothetical protein LSH36_55g02011 [Paralvinella palmiformis]